MLFSVFRAGKSTIFFNSVPKKRRFLAKNLFYDKVVYLMRNV